MCETQVWIIEIACGDFWTNSITMFFSIGRYLGVPNYIDENKTSNQSLFICMYDSVADLDMFEPLF